MNKKPTGSYSADDPDRPRWDASTTPCADYPYRDEDGNERFTVHKGKNGAGENVYKMSRPNLIPPGDRLNPEDKVERFDNAGEEHRILYNLPGIAKAKADEVIYFTEGEKDAETIIGFGLVGTTVPCGAGKWQDNYAFPLHGRHVVLTPDNDEKGRRHAALVGSKLEGFAASVRVLELPGLAETQDVSDWIAAGHSAADLVALLPTAKAYSEWANQAGQFYCAKGTNIPVPTPGNIRLAVAKLGVTLRHDMFAGRETIEGLAGFGPALDDPAIRRMWLLAEERFKLRTNKERFSDVIIDYARRNSYHPVCDYLDGLQWDGTPRIDNWLVAYAGADDNEFTRAVGALMLLASVRRVREPGCKFDEMIVLESSQGTNKSSALAVLSVKPEWFSDDLPLNADSKVVIERLSGHWIVEAAELKGMRRGEVEQIKAMLSRQEDKARLSYGRLPVTRPRQCTIWGSTNNDAYLRDTTGNRRFWPVKVTRFDLARLQVDRDQLWAEAAAREARGDSIRLPEALWGAAAGEQEERQAIDPFLEALTAKLTGLEGKIRAEDVWTIVGVQPGHRTQDHNVRLGEAMQVLGWRRKKLRFGGPNPEFAYAKGDEREQLLACSHWNGTESRQDVWVGVGDPPVSVRRAREEGGTFPPNGAGGRTH